MDKDYRGFQFIIDPASMCLVALHIETNINTNIEICHKSLQEFGIGYLTNQMEVLVNILKKIMKCTQDLE